MEKSKNNQSFRNYTDELISHYKVPFRTKKEEALNTILSRIDQKENISVKSKRREISWMYTGVGIAASIFLALMLYFFTAQVEVVSGNNEVLVWSLPDNSRIVLQENSVVNYRRYFWNRKINMNGTVYYEVEKGSRFIVYPTNGKVEVLGTRFLVSDKQENLNVQCYEGKVKTIYNNTDWILTKGTMFNGEVNQVRDVEKANEDYPEFAHFNKTYRNIQLSKIVNDVEQFFKVHVKVEAGAGKTFSGSFETGNLNAVMQILTESLQLQYEFTDSNNIKITN